MDNEIKKQIGYYLHAIPRLEFARNGKNQFVLTFQQLGGTEYGENDSNKITVFNSRNLDNFFTQYDSYVTNLFSPQNEVDEWLVCKTSDDSFLTSNNTAEIQTKYGITEIVKFDISMIKNDEWKTEPALEYIFEKSIYDTLTSRTDYIPAKWSALYFSLGDNKIRGLNYVPPTPNNDGFMALKTIVGRLFNNNVTDRDLKFNDLKFHIRYKTQDSLRLTQLRPDLDKFMKNSEFENYPHHEQFFNQQDKIIDSERFSANLWGKLVRVANGVYQCQEYAESGKEKVPGQLVTIDRDKYYVMECDNEYYADGIFQKVTYSKNFNQLAQIVTIPSEPRFYEISERSMIRREVRLFDFIKLSSIAPENVLPPRFINNSQWEQFVKDLLFCDGGNPELPNFAYTNFKADIQRDHIGLPNNNVAVLFPSSEAQNISGAIQPKASAQHRAVIVPLLHFPLRNAIVFEWDMDDNFKAGDAIDTETSGAQKNGNAEIIDTAYYSLQPVRYCDVYGRADLYDFKLFYEAGWTCEQIRRLPFAESTDFKPTDAQSKILIPENLSIGLDKDNREALSFNYQISLLYDTDGFVTFPNLFGTKMGRLKVALLKDEISMFDETVDFDVARVVAPNVEYYFAKTGNAIRLDFADPTDDNGNTIDISKVGSIVFYDEENGLRYAYMAKNVKALKDSDKLQSWYLYSVFNDIE